MIATQDSQVAGMDGQLEILEAALSWHEFW